MNPAFLESLTIQTHDTIIENSGGLPGIKNLGLIQSAVNRPFHGTADGKEFYGDLFKKTAALTQSLSLNHGFEDGNKRTGLAMGMMFLFRNGFYIPEQDIKTTTDFALEITNADHSRRLNIDQISEWFKSKAKIKEQNIMEDYIKVIKNIRLEY